MSEKEVEGHLTKERVHRIKNVNKIMLVQISYTITYIIFIIAQYIHKPFVSENILNRQIFCLVAKKEFLWKYIFLMLV